MIESKVPERVPFPWYILEIEYVSELFLLLGPWLRRLAERDVVR